MVDSGSPEEQLAGFIGKYSPAVQSQAIAILEKMRERLPNAVEMVYDNYNALVCGFCPGDRPSEAVFSIVLYPAYVTLCFIHGAGMPDPHGLLKGTGSQVRHIRLNGPDDLDLPAVRDTMEIAMEHAPVRFDPGQPYRLVIKSISVKQRPRLPSRSI
jgi:hypothetical protein